MNLETFLIESGPGVARRDSDLTETNLAQSARPGDTFMNFADGGKETVEFMMQKLELTGKLTRQMIGPAKLRGTRLQIPLF